MAENIAGMQVEGTMVGVAASRRGRPPLQRVAAYGAIAAMLAVVLIIGMAMHDRRASHPAAPVIARTIGSAQTRFLENNTTNLPNAVTPDVRPVVTVEQQKFLEVNTTMPDPGVVTGVGASPVTTIEQQRLLEVNTTMFPNTVAADVASPVMTRSQQRFLEVNTMLPTGGLYPYAEDVTPLPGRPR